jgi:hypothetical protein
MLVSEKVKILLLNQETDLFLLKENCIAQLKMLGAVVSFTLN